MGSIGPLDKFRAKLDTGSTKHAVLEAGIAGLSRLEGHPVCQALEIEAPVIKNPN